MEKTWTVVRFEEENVVEAVLTTWITNNKCYWPPYTIKKIIKAIKDHVEFNPSWTSYEMYVFKDSTSDSYQACRGKAKKAEETSDLNSDNNKRKIKKKRNYDSDSGSESDIESTILSSPPNLQEHSDIEISDNRCNKNVENNTCATFYLNDKCFNKENRTSDQKSSKNKKYITENTYFGKKTVFLNNDVPRPSNINVYTSNIKQRYSQKDKEADNNAQICTCCPIHKNSDEKFRRVFKKIILVRETIKECSENLKVGIMEKLNVNLTDTNKPTFLSTFNFPLQNLQELEEVERYLEEKTCFQSTVREMSKIGGTTPYDFIKQCLSLLFTNKFAELYSWYGAKKKEIFGKLHLANVLLESAQLCKAAKNRKEVEEAIKAWLRRAKERAVKEEN